MTVKHSYNSTGLCDSY